MRLRILTWNLWHGLNPYGKVLMLPMESASARSARMKRQLDVIRGWTGAHDVICLQELNPMRKRLSEIQAGTGLMGEGTVVNQGLKLGSFGIPPMLQEGLGILHGSAFESGKFREILLSGSGYETILPGGISLSLQISEKRKALVFETVCERLKIAVINLHLHNGSDEVPKDLHQKTGEIQILAADIKSRLEKFDFVAVCGDFNSDPGSVCMRPLLDLGFEAQEPQITWNPGRNPLASNSPEKAPNEELRRWDAGQHAFDRIYIRTRLNLRDRKTGVIEEPTLSDHFAFWFECEVQV